MFLAPRLFPDTQLPAGTGMWAEACVWACDAFNKSATTANPGNTSSHELFLGSLPPLTLLPFMKPGYCRVRRVNKAVPKAEPCFLNGGRNHPRDSVRVLLPSGRTTCTRDITWECPREPFLGPVGGGGRILPYPTRGHRCCRRRRHTATGRDRREQPRRRHLRLRHRRLQRRR